MPGNSTKHRRDQRRQKHAREVANRAAVAEAAKKKSEGEGVATITPPPKNKGGRPRKRIPPKKKRKLEEEAKERECIAAEEAKQKERLAARSRLRSAGPADDSVPPAPVAAVSPAPVKDDKPAAAAAAAVPAAATRPVTRSTAPPEPRRSQRTPKPTQPYDATPAALFRRPDHNPCAKSKAAIPSLRLQRNNAQNECDKLRKDLAAANKNREELNKELLKAANTQPGDLRPLSDCGDCPPVGDEPSRPPPTRDDLVDFIKAALKTRDDLVVFIKAALKRSKDNLSDDQVGSVLTALGLDKLGRATNETKKAQLAKGI